jgi:hypothetical protein
MDASRTADRQDADKKHRWFRAPVGVAIMIAAGIPPVMPWMV